MDIDISDILADVSRPIDPSTTQSQPHLDSSTSFSDHQLLVRAWTSERNTPFLLPYPQPLLDRLMSRIRAQITRIEDLTSGISSNPYTTTAVSANTNTNLTLSILQTDLSRTQFIVRSYLRQRLSKLTMYAAHYAKQQVGDDESLAFSATESAFLRHHQALLSRFYNDSFLSAFPDNLTRLDDKVGGVDMVEGPDVGSAVVVRCLAEGWGNEERVEAEEEEGVSTELRMARGEVWVVRWRDVRDGVVGGELELL